MADISITKFRVQIPRNGATPSTPGFAQSEGQDPVNPPGSPTGIYVPYLGATGSVNLGEFGLTSGFVTFDTTPTGTPTTQGTMFWDEDDLTVDVILNGYQMKIGEDVFYPVKNQTGSNIAKGTAVRFAGTVGASSRLLIEPFTANGTYASSRFMGVTAEDIDNGEDGKVLWFGRIRGINTNAFNEGDILYASTTVAGGYQTTVPVPPNNIIEVAAVVTKSINQGVIFVRPTFASNINRDEGVKITSGTAGDLLQLQAGGLWENKSLATIGLHTGTLTANYIPKATGATTLANSKIYEVNDRILINKTTDSGGTLQVNGSIQLSSNVQINNAFGLYFDEDNRIKMDSGFGWDISSWTKTVFSKGNVEISAGTLSTRASSTASAATQIPVFTADPSSTMRAVVTRTPAQLLGDMGGLSDAPNDGNYYGRKSATWVKLYGQAADVSGGVFPASPLYIDPSDGNYIEVYTGFGEVVIDGIKDGYEGREMFIWSNSNYANVILNNNAAAASASDRFSLSAATYSSLAHYRPIHLIYIDSRWRVINS